MLSTACSVSFNFQKQKLKKVIAIFDIGKTNKKFFLFDQKFKEVYQTYVSFPEIEDDDGYPSDDLNAIREWIFDIMDQVQKSKKFTVKAINFTTYGATLVHLDDHQNVITPLYNYTKQMPYEIITEFIKKYGSNIFDSTGCPRLGFLNSGIQLFWLKKIKPAIYNAIKHSLHFPQYLSSLFSGVYLSELTSIGCHTALWDHNNQEYHQWVLKEGIDLKLPEIVPSQYFTIKKIGNSEVKVGVGIHDSSAALAPYLYREKDPFILLSTGTWSICLNPFASLETIDKNKCKPLLYLDVCGRSVLASQLFLGKEYDHQVKQLIQYFGKKKSLQRKMKFKSGLYSKLRKANRNCFEFKHIRKGQDDKTNTISWKTLKSFRIAYHQLMFELMSVQQAYITEVISTTPIKKIFIDGGFAQNNLFVSILGLHFPNFKIRSSKKPLGSALGAAIMVSEDLELRKVLKKKYKMNKHKMVKQKH